MRMAYNYEEEKPTIFTESGQVMFLRIRDRTKKLLEQSGSVRMQEVIRECSGSSWQMLACVDRLVELGELREVTAGMDCAGQDRIFVAR